MEKLKILFLENPDLAEQIEAFCEQNPAFLKAKLEFYETAHEIARIAGYDLYDRFERRLGDYLDCYTGLYYLFGLGLRQEVLSALQPEVS